jgi:thiamine-monophosphate kinase
MREFELLHHIYASNKALGPRVRIGPGDDMALVELAGLDLLAAVDQLVEGRHYRADSTPLELIGRKAMTRSLSDIAAMAARPVASLVAATLPPDFGSDRAMQLFDAMRETAAKYACPLIGGDIAMHAGQAAPLVCSVTVLAEPAAVGPITRSGAQIGDHLYVTGRLGGSLQPDGGGRHLTFTPRIDEAIILAQQLATRLHAMIDVSDGLGRDAGHIAELSGVQIELDAAAIPCSDSIEWRRALSDGEDYELCFAASGTVPKQILDLPVTRVGRVLAAAPGQPPVVVRDGRTLHPADQLGWQHAS